MGCVEYGATEFELSIFTDSFRTNPLRDLDSPRSDRKREQEVDDELVQTGPVDGRRVTDTFHTTGEGRPRHSLFLRRQQSSQTDTTEETKSD